MSDESPIDFDGTQPIDIHNCALEDLDLAAMAARNISGRAAVLTAQLEMACHAEQENTGLRDLAEHMRDHAVRTFQLLEEDMKRLTY